MRALTLILALSIPLPALAGGLIAARILPAGTVIAADDLDMAEGGAKGVIDPARVIGLETRITIHEGRPIQTSLLRRPTLVGRNQIVRMSFQRGTLHIVTDGRALDEGGAGDLIRVMNLTSRNTVTARIAPDGSLHAAR
ncbi:flagellar basal body P-ring formation chaperone FlgA [Paracoccus alkanivorans]|uniref:Flagella basal body P-ring formation protein FlgA n=1 Tax=Paracoccus alkanivorans TaxID=2116655 RepID=A0A3M0M7B4_9RHOB|nr:flagellar basal body P-ring formation chaperone FlgA [Paracoccus alkanivorans]RMC33285.1 flagella basal body P-ring formation protein FlgA [Paracoccus alkanivorans]